VAEEAVILEEEAVVVAGETRISVRKVIIHDRNAKEVEEGARLPQHHQLTTSPNRQPRDLSQRTIF